MEDKILHDYQIRKTYKEKSRFINYLSERLGGVGYQEGKELIVTEQKGLFKSRNIIVGDPENADILITAHYDTCARAIFPNKFYPTNWLVSKSNALAYAGIIALIPILITTIISLIIIIVTTYYSIQLNMYMLFDAWITANIILIVSYALQTYIGISNKHTANDNTSGIITITQILESIPDNYRKRICAVYFDNEEKGLIGSNIFYKQHIDKVKDKLVINFDCVGDGKYFTFTHNVEAQRDKNYAILLKCFKDNEDDDIVFIGDNAKYRSSDHKTFPKGVSICAANKNRAGILYVNKIHTCKDTCCSKENIEYLVRAMIGFIENYK